MAKYEVWARVDGKRKRLLGGFESEAAARKAAATLVPTGTADVVIVQRPASYGRIKGLQKRGLSKR